MTIEERIKNAAQAVDTYSRKGYSIEIMMEPLQDLVKETARRCAEILDGLAKKRRQDANATQSASEGDAYEACLSLDAEAHGLTWGAATIRSEFALAGREGEEKL